MAIIGRDPPNCGFKCRWGRQKLWFSTNIWLLDQWLVQCDQQYTIDGAVVDRSVYRAGRHTSVDFACSMDNYAKGNRAQFDCKSEVEVINNRVCWLCSRYCTTEANHSPADMNHRVASLLLMFCRVQWSVLCLKNLYSLVVKKYLCEVISLMFVILHDIAYRCLQRFAIIW